jgi:hypothetical protein
VRTGLDLESTTLRGVYDQLPKSMQQAVAQQIPAARAILATQYPGKPAIASSGLQVLVDCVQKAQAGRESVAACSAPALAQKQRRIEPARRTGAIPSEQPPAAHDARSSSPAASR